MECDFEEDADLLFAGLSILSLGKASKKMQDQRKKLKDKRAEADIAKRYGYLLDNLGISSRESE